ncbi:hypothetical protein OROMI_014827 [Orobanche minor]
MEFLETCYSKASTISATSEESPIKDEKKKEKSEEGSLVKAHESTSSHVVLDLKLANDDERMNNGNPNSKLELNLCSSSNIARELSNDGAHKPLRPKTFTCNYYRREAIAKHRHGVVDMKAAAGSPSPFRHQTYPYYPYKSFPLVPLYGTFNRSSFGVRAESMIRKPYPYQPPWSPQSLLYCYQFRHEKMSGDYILNPQSLTRYDRLRMESLHFSHQINGGGSRLGHKHGATLKYNPSSNPNTIVSNACNEEKAKANGGLNNRWLRSGNVGDGNAPTDANSGLDLDLKL